MEINQVCFAFGENDSYFFSSPAAWAWRNLPASLSAELSNDRYQYVRAQNVALGSQGRWYLSGNKQCSSTGQIVAANAWSANLPPRLAAWLPHREIRTLEVVFGPGESYFAWDDHGHCFDNLPTLLNQILAKWASEIGVAAIQPRIVALGHGGSFFILTQQNMYAYDATASSVILDREIDACRDTVGQAWFNGLNMLSINPFKPAQWIYFDYAWNYGIRTPDEWDEATDPVVAALRSHYQTRQTANPFASNYNYTDSLAALNEYTKALNARNAQSMAQIQQYTQYLQAKNAQSLAQMQNYTRYTQQRNAQSLADMQSSTANNLNNLQNAIGSPFAMPSLSQTSTQSPFSPVTPSGSQADYFPAQNGTSASEEDNKKKKRSSLSSFGHHVGHGLKWGAKATLKGTAAVVNTAVNVASVSTIGVPMNSGIGTTGNTFNLNL